MERRTALTNREGQRQREARAAPFQLNANENPDAPIKSLAQHSLSAQENKKHVTYYTGGKTNGK